jgi:hypothetical protein
VAEAIAGIRAEATLDPKGFSAGAAKIVADAERIKAQGERAFGAFDKSVRTLTTSLSGAGLAQKVQIVETAVARMGGVSTLSAAQVSRLRVEVDKLAASGAKIPASLKLPEIKGGGSLATLGEGLKAGATQELTGLAGPLGSVGTALSAIGPAGLAAAAGIGALAAAGAAAVSFTVQAVTGFVEAGSKLSDLAAQTGISTTALQEFAFAGKLSGVSADQIAGAVFKMEKAIGAGSKGFKAIGLDIEELRRMKPEEAFKQVAAALGSITNEAEFAAKGAGIFQKSFADIAPVIRAGLADATAEAHNLGAIMDEETVAAADRLGDSATKLAEAWSGAKNQFGAAVVEGLKLDDALEGMLSVVKALNEAAKELSGGGFGLGDAIKSIADATPLLQNLTRGLEALGKLRGVGPIESPDLRGATAKGVGGVFAKPSEIPLPSIEAMVSALEKGKGAGEGLSTAMSKAGAEAKKAADEILRHAEEIRKLADSLTGAEAGKKAADLAEALRLPGVSDALLTNRDKVAEIGTQIDKLVKDGLASVPPELQRIREAAAQIKLGDIVQQNLAKIGSVKFQKDLLGDSFKKAGDDAKGLTGDIKGIFDEIDKGRTLWDPHEAALQELRASTEAWDAALANIESAAQGIGGRFGQILQAAAGIGGALNKLQAIGGEGSGKKGLGAIGAGLKDVFSKDKKKSSAAIGAAGDVLEAAGGLAGGPDTKLGGALSGAGKGAKIGAIAGPYGAAIGAIIGGVIGFMKGAKIQKQAKEAGEALGVKVSVAMGKAIAAQAKSLKIDIKSAALLHIADAAKESGKKVHEFGGAILDLMAKTTSGAIPAAEGTAAIAEAFGSVREEADKAGVVGDRLTVNMLNAARATGGLSTEMKAFVNDSLDLAISGVGNLIAGLDLKGNARAAQASGEIFSATFWGAVKDKGLVQASDAMRETFDKLKENLPEGALSDVKRVLNLTAEGTQFRGAAQAGQGLADALKGLADAGYLTQASLNSFGTASQAAFDQAVAGGANAKEAISAILPELQNAVSAAAQYGFALDPATEGLVNQAKAAGFAFPVDPMLKVVDLLGAIAVKMGAVSQSYLQGGAAATGMASTTAAAGETMRTSLTTAARDGVGAFRETTATIGPAFQSAADQASASLGGIAGASRELGSVLATDLGTAGQSGIGAFAEAAAGIGPIFQGIADQASVSLQGVAASTAGLGEVMAVGLGGAAQAGAAAFVTGIGQIAGATRDAVGAAAGTFPDLAKTTASASTTMTKSLAAAIAKLKEMKTAANAASSALDGIDIPDTGGGGGGGAGKHSFAKGGVVNAPSGGMTIPTTFHGVEAVVPLDSGDIPVQLRGALKIAGGRGGATIEAGAFQSAPTIIVQVQGGDANAIAIAVAQKISEEHEQLTAALDEKIDRRGNL